MAEERVTVDDIVEVLAKHAPSPSDPDDADTLARFNQQVLDARTEREGKAGEERQKQAGPQQPQKART